MAYPLANDTPYRFRSCDPQVMSLGTLPLS